jgi:anti-anti-sigma factor
MDPTALGINEDVHGDVVVIDFATTDNNVALERARLFFGEYFLNWSQNWRSIVIDLSAVAYLDSAALGPLLVTSKRLREGGGDLALCGIDAPGLREILTLTRLDQVLTILPDRATALAQLSA